MSKAFNQIFIISILKINPTLKNNSLENDVIFPQKHYFLKFFSNYHII